MFLVTAEVAISAVLKLKVEARLFHDLLLRLKLYVEKVIVEEERICTRLPSWFPGATHGMTVCRLKTKEVKHGFTVLVGAEARVAVEVHVEFNLVLVVLFGVALPHGVVIIILKDLLLQVEETLCGMHVQVRHYHVLSVR